MVTHCVNETHGAGKGAGTHRDALWSAHSSPRGAGFFGSDPHVRVRYRNHCQWLLELSCTASHQQPGVATMSWGSPPPEPKHAASSESESQRLSSLMMTQIVSVCFTAVAGTLVLGLCLDTIRLRSSMSLRRRRLRGHYIRPQPPEQPPSLVQGRDAESRFHGWQCRRSLKHGAALMVLSALLWAHAAIRAPCLAVVACSCLLLTMVVAPGNILMSRLLVVLRVRDEVSWQAFRLITVQMVVVLDIVLLYLLYVMNTGPPIDPEWPHSSSCTSRLQLPQWPWLQDLLPAVPGWVDPADTTIDVLSMHFPPINAMIAAFFTIGAVGLHNLDPAICLAEVSLQVIMSLIIISFPRQSFDMDGYMKVYGLVSQWVSFGFGVFAITTLYAPHSREVFEVQQFHDRSDDSAASTDQCAVCLDRTVTEVFLPCGHRCCKPCCDRILATSRSCPLCREATLAAVHMY